MDIERWRQLMVRLAFDDNEAVFQTLYKAYSETHRFYHTHRHIDVLLKHFESSRAQAHQPDDVEVAIWFHDCIYKPFSSSNELDSANLAVDFLKKNGADAQRCRNVHSLIMATRHTAEVDDQDQKLLVDIDLSILGATEAIYAQFERDVRKEYRWVPMPIYRRKRKQLLADFLRRDAVFQTAFYRQKCELNALRNLAKAIADLG
ncbi:metal-dependent hydrolase [Simiduia litorea]|uniref:HD domain-containing protein n=1 Tax=Simiduia litorea TaxID=1435348 RepID=UPI0036F39044